MTSYFEALPKVNALHIEQSFSDRVAIDELGYGNAVSDSED